MKQAETRKASRLENLFSFSQLLGSLSVVGIAIAVGTVLLLAIHRDPVAVYGYILLGSLGTPTNVTRTVQVTEVLILTGLAFLIPARAGLWNIGAEGQLYVGAAGAIMVIFAIPNLGAVSMILALVAGGVFGGLWCGVSGFLKGKYHVDEAVTTILLNPVAIFFVDYLIAGPYRDRNALIPQTPYIPNSASLPQIIPGLSIEPGIIIALLAIISSFFLLKRTKFGFEIRALGGNKKAAEYAGINVTKLSTFAMLLGGSFSGLAGSILVQGNVHYLSSGISPGYGYLGIAVSTLAANEPIYTLVSGFFFGILQNGNGLAAAATGIPATFVEIVSSLIIILMVIRVVLSKRLRF